MSTVDGYLRKLPDDRRSALTAIRDTINANLPAGYEEGLQYGMISWFVPLSRYPDTYNKQPLCLLALGAQKNHLAMYLMTVYGDPKTRTWFTKAYADAGKKLDMGKSCVRFKKLDDVPLDVIGQLVTKVDVDTYVATTREIHASMKTSKAKVAKKSRNKPTPKQKPTPNQKAAPKKAAPKKAAPRKAAPRR